MKKNIIPYGKQFIDHKDINEVKKSLKEKLITTGNYVVNFELEIKKKFQSKHALTCSNATAGLHLAYLSIGLKKGDTVVMPAINFISAYRMASLIEAKIYLADVNPITGQMTPETLLECIKKNKLTKIKAIVVMYLGGYVENNFKFYKIKKKYKCCLIEDACHAFGGKYSVNNKSYSVGSCKHSDLCVFSFHALKNITTGEGGIITTNNKKYADKIKLLRSHGIQKEKKYWKYDINELGYNYRLSDINCALGLSQLKKLNLFFLKRKKIVEFYKKKFLKINSFLKFSNNLNKYNCYHFFLVSINFKKIKSTKDQLIAYLNRKGIFPQFHYIPIFKFKFFNRKKTNKYSGAIEYYKNTLSLPVYYELSEQQQLYIIKSIKNFISKK
jgi:dTDP-4-amino-4,6-dideoxygalactose transaminase